MVKDKNGNEHKIVVENGRLCGFFKKKHHNCRKNINNQQILV